MLLHILLYREKMRNVFSFIGEKYEEKECLEDKEEELEVRKEMAHLGGEREEPSEPTTEGINETTTY